MRTSSSLGLIVAASLAVAALPAFGAPSQDPPAASRSPYSAADTNKDGFVDRQEWQAQRDRIFERLDTDRDGSLSREELQGGRRDQPRGRAAANGGTSGNSPGPRGDRFSRLDTDGNGRIDRSEFAAASDRLFARCDRDGDGRIARGECRGDGNRRAATRRSDPRTPGAQ